MEDLNVRLEFTPNPNSLKYSINRELLDRGTENFTSYAEAKEKSPLAAMLFGIMGVEAVMLGTNFVTLTINEEEDIEKINDETLNKITEHFQKGEKVFHNDFQRKVKTVSSENLSDEDQKIVQRIQEILESEIRPAVAMDGGDIQFESYQDGKVFVNLTGSCSGCPSSTLTLKDGIQTRLQQEIPQVTEVLSI